MIVHLLALHRHETYPGQHGPEIRGVCDEFTLEENPTWWDQEIARQRRSVGNDAAAWAQVSVSVDDNTLLAALYPQRTPVPARVVTAVNLPVAEDPAARAGTEDRDQTGRDA